MSIITRLDKDLYLSYSWSNINHGICGHTFEVIEYFWILKDHFNIGIYLAELDKHTFKKAIVSKYNFSEQEVQLILDNTTFGNKAKLLKVKNILFTDGGIININNMTILADNILGFACGNRYTKHNKIIMLQDNRLYDSHGNTINYVKKILFSRLKDVTLGNKTFLYLTENCRDLDIDTVNLLSETNDILLGSNNDKYIDCNVQNVKLPIKDLYSKINKYIYTRVNRKWDCSNRMIAECKHYNIEVQYHDIDYLDIDKGLKVRIQDCENINKITLDSNDDIILLLKDIL